MGWLWVEGRSKQGCTSLRVCRSCLLEVEAGGTFWGALTPLGYPSCSPFFQGWGLLAAALLTSRWQTLF